MRHASVVVSLEVRTHRRLSPEAAKRAALTPHWHSPTRVPRRTTARTRKLKTPHREKPRSARIQHVVAPRRAHRAAGQHQALVSPSDTKLQRKPAYLPRVFNASPFCLHPEAERGSEQVSALSACCVVLSAARTPRFSLELADEVHHSRCCVVVEDNARRARTCRSSQSRLNAPM